MARWPNWLNKSQQHVLGGAVAWMAFFAAARTLGWNINHRGFLADLVASTVCAGLVMYILVRTPDDETQVSPLVFIPGTTVFFGACSWGFFTVFVGWQSALMPGLYGAIFGLVVGICVSGMTSAKELARFVAEMKSSRR